MTKETRPQPGQALPAPASDQIFDVPLSAITTDPDQPRKTFSAASLAELANSIDQNGLVQPISIREVQPGAFYVIAGERRYRAHQLLGRETVPARVLPRSNIGEIRVLQLIENSQRVDVSPLEEAVAYQRLLDQEGWTVDELAKRLGINQPWRITERTNLLRLPEKLQNLLASGNLTQSQATELVRLSPRGQDTLLRLIRTDRCRTYADLRNAATAILEAEAQMSMLADPEPPASEAEQRAARTFGGRVEQIAAMLRDGISENELVAVRKVNPNDADRLADLLALMVVDIRRIETGLRKVAAQASLLAA